MGAARVLAILFSVVVIVCCLPSPEIARTARNTRTENMYRLPRHTIPIHYDVRLIPDVSGESSTLEGESKTIIEVSREVTEIVFHADNLTISENFTSLENSDGKVHRPTHHNYDKETEMLHLLFNEVLIPGLYFMNLTFSGSMSSDLYGFYNSFHDNGNGSMVWLAATHFQLIAARRVFPCWDEPALKATFKMSIKHWGNYTALSNMPLYKQERDETDGRVWSHFETTPIMSTNILAFVVADYANFTNADGTIRIWTRKNAISHARYILDIAERANLAFQEYLNSTLHLPKTDHVSIPHYSSRATENWGLFVYHERAFIHNENQDKTMFRISNVMTVVHETSHQWFGNLVSPAWWKYLWMSEGMAKYLDYYMTDKLYKDWRVMDMFLLNIYQKALAAEDMYNAGPLNRNVSSPREIRRRDVSIIYRKSASVIRMMSHILSEDVFRTGLIKYIVANEYDSVTSDDLWKAMQAALNESGRAGTQVKEIMDTWVEQTGYPIVTVARDYDSGRAIVSQESTTADKDPMQKRWWIPLTYATKSNPNFNSTLPSNWLKPDSNSVSIDVNNDDWIVVNVQGTGYYRVNYDDESWRKIARFLNSEEYTKVHLLNRAQILDDAYYMLKHGKLDPITFIHITNYLARETDHIPWLVMLNIFGTEFKYFGDPEVVRVLKPHLVQLMNNLVESIDFDVTSDDNNFTTVSRAEILTWACKLDHPLCTAKATAKLIAHLENPNDNKLTPDMTDWVYCMGLKKANQTIWNRVLEAGNVTLNIINYLGCTEDPAIAENYLKMSIDGQSNVWKYYSSDVPTSLGYNIPSHTETILNFVINEWQRIVTLMPGPHLMLSNLLYQINTQDQLERYKSFLLQWGIPEDTSVSYRERGLEMMKKNAKDMLEIFDRYRNETEDTPSSKIL